jgi:hypothetical protein
MACNTVKSDIEGVALHAVPYGGVSEAERDLLRNTAPLTKVEEAELVETLLHEHSPANLDLISSLLRAGKDPRRIVDAIQIAAAEIVLATHGVSNFSMPMHCYQYTNALGWFYDNFDHPRRARLLYVAAEFVNMTAWHQALTKELVVQPIPTPVTAPMLNRAQVAAKVNDAICALNGPESVAWTKAYIDHFGADDSLIRTLALCSCKMGNDPHNQEIPQGMLEDFVKNRGAGRGRILLAAAQLLSAHRKYGDPFEAANRFGAALKVAV